MIKKLKFEEEEFIVDWISLKIQSLHLLSQERLVDYLFQIGFNSYFRSRKSKSSSKNILRVDPTNFFEVVFRRYSLLGRYDSRIFRNQCQRIL